MSDERKDIDDAPEGFRLKPLSGAEVPEEAVYEQAPRLSDAPAPKSTPIADAHVMSDAEVSEVKAGREREKRRAQARVSGRSFLKIIALLLVIVGVIVAMVSLHNSGATTGSTTPTSATPPSKPTPVARTHQKRGKKADRKQGKHEKSTAKKKPKKLPQVIAVPVHKPKHKHPAQGAGTRTPTPSQNTTINGLQAQESGHTDKLVAKAEKILEAKKYPAVYRKHPQKLKAYMEKELDYPVSLANVTDKTGVLGMQVLLPIGKVLLTHLQSGDLAPQITWVKLWTPDLTP